MNYLSSKNLSILLLVGIMLFPIGITPSYAQTTTNSMNVIGTVGSTLDLTAYNEISNLCLFMHSLESAGTRISGGLGTLSFNGECFQHSSHTWQGFILNVDDDNVLGFTSSVTTSSTNDIHRVDFTGLELGTKYRLVFLLTGSYSSSFRPAMSGHQDYVPDTTVYRVVEISTHTPPIAPDFTVEAITGQTITIPFSEHVSNPAGDYSDLDISFSIQDSALYSEFTSYSGTSQSTATSGDLDVTANSVGIENSLAADYDVDTLIDYVATNRVNSLPTSGVITINYVDLIGDVMANLHTVTLTNLFALPTLDITIPRDAITSSILEGTQISDRAITLLAFTTNGTGNGTGTTPDGTIVPAPGTLTITNPTDSTGPVFHYTPASGFVGVEAFEYTATSDTNGATSAIYFVVPTVQCDASMIPNFNFGDLSDGEESDETSMDIMNIGNVNAKLVFKGENWKSNSASTDIMNVEQTKYSLTDSKTYGDKTALTTTENIPDTTLGEDGLSVYLQVAVDLITPSFRGAATQEMTVSSVCS